MISDANQMVVANLKAAKNELEKDYSASTSAAKIPSKNENNKPAPKLAPQKETDLFQVINKHQKELRQEQSVLEEEYQKTKELTEKLAGRIELLKKLQVKGAEVNVELKKFEEQVIIAKKENCDFLNQIKKEKYG
ncbi:hypothetical protein KKG29_01555 [Patescibacteria group bacterium]|nr:hypothetical protein [Patescibacteria group bacterium]MBU3999849.1 hypothetical protein [Patescibacteria group bacterium]MBU4056989.1 hypothetical protein [Patescibacteria group bacterium]MBU4369093.1 hypothetical protein [Patescibacteria group bacterium]